jgi:hypothetical protein
MPEDERIVHPNDSLLAEVLQHARQPNGSISYSALQSDTNLTAYLREVAMARPEIFPSRHMQLAFWINAHNAYALDMLRSNGPVRSIEQISGFKSGKVAWIAGARYSLDDIEHGLLARTFREPRAFFALFDGSKETPPLPSMPYVEATLSEQLDAQIHEFLADTLRNYLDKKQSIIYLSPVFREYREELEKPAGSLMAFVRAFAPPEMGAWIDAHPLVKTQFLRYDYSLFTSDAEPARESTRESGTQPQRKPQPGRKPSGGIR